MKKLLPKYWKSFELWQNGTEKKDGDKFEQLVSDILNIQYKEKGVTFTRTQTTHDGSKDFVGTKDGQDIIWAECKNYKKNISLTQVSPTLVMAEVCQINEIIFFSYSEITKGTIEKLFSYAELRKKKLRLYDGETLESLILSLGGEILTKYFPEYEENLDKGYVIKPYAFLALEKDPQFFPLGQNERKSDGLDSFKSIAIGDIFSADIFVVNRDAVNPIMVEVDFLPNTESPDDFFCFAFLDERIKVAEGKKTITFWLEPSTVFSERIFIRYSKFKSSVYLPVIRICCYETKEQCIYQKELNYPAIKTNWTRKAVFSGSGYETVKAEFQEKCLNKHNFSGALIYGNSGTGKTRLLEECVGELLSKKYHVLNFTGWDKYPVIQIIKELVYMLYGLTDELILDSFTENIAETVRPEFRQAIFLLKQLNSNLISRETIEQYYELIFEKLMQSEYTLIIDNLQYFDVELLTFLRKLIQYGLNRRRPTKTVILCSITLDQSYDDRYIEFIAEFHELSYTAQNRFYCKQILGFEDEKQAISFLASILRTPIDQLDSRQMRETLARCSLRPKYIDEMAHYLIQEKQIIFGQQGGTIPNPVRLLETIKELPTEYGLLFKKRYNSLVESNKLIETSLTKFLSLIHLFKPLDDFTLVRLGNFSSELELLLKGGILKKEQIYNRIVYTFEHDLIEQYFITNDSNFLNYAIDYLNQSIAISWLRDRFPVQYCLCCFRSGNINQEIIEDILLLFRNLLVPTNIEKQFYNEMVNWLVELKIGGHLSNINFLQFATDCCVHIRDFIGEEVAITAFSACYNQVNKMNLTDPTEIREHFAFFIHYTENRNHLELTQYFQENIKIYENYLDFLLQKSKDFPELKNMFDYAYSYIQNRIFVCGKHLGSHKQYLNELNESTKCGEKYGYQDIIFSNNFDASTAFLYEDTDIALKYMKDGITAYEEQENPKYKLNYYKKKIQYAIITNKTIQLDKTIDDAFSCLQSSTEVKYHTYFRNCLLRLKATYLLMQNAPLDIIKRTLEQLSMSQLLLNKNNDYIILFLLAKYSFRLNSKVVAVEYYESALLKCTEKAISGGALRDKYNIVIIEDELVYALHALNKRELAKHKRNLKGKISNTNWNILNMNKQDYRKYRENFHSCALAVSADGKEGFLL